MTTEHEAAERAETYNTAHMPDLGPRTWKGESFPGGWLMNPQGEDLEWRTGVVCLIVLDDGRIIEESSSMPPDWIIAKHTATGG